MTKSVVIITHAAEADPGGGGWGGCNPPFQTRNE